MTQPANRVTDTDRTALIEYLKGLDDPARRPAAPPAQPIAPDRPPVDRYTPGGPITDRSVCHAGCHGVDLRGRRYETETERRRLEITSAVVTAGIPVGGAIRAGTTAVTAASRRLSSLFASRAGRTAPAASVAATLPRTLVAAERQLQAKFKHAADFGVKGNYNRANAAEYAAALQRHVASPGTRQIAGHYRKQEAVHYLDPRTGLNVVTDRAGNFLSGWRLEGRQLQDVLTKGWLW